MGFSEHALDGEKGAHYIYVVNDNGTVKCYEDAAAKNAVQSPRDTIYDRVSKTATRVVSTTFLPIGYPQSVRSEYLEYQLWDSAQGLSSYLRSVLTTRSVLQAAGVGSADATPLAAALTWVFKDGLGMVGSLLLAYLYSNSFEMHTKEFRLLADVLNNVGLTIDLISGNFPQLFLALTSLRYSPFLHRTIPYPLLEPSKTFYPNPNPNQLH
jgi:hypothetical protein